MSLYNINTALISLVIVTEGSKYHFVLCCTLSSKNEK